MILGISIDENFVYVNVDGTDDVVRYPFAIGRNLSNNNWFIGDDARFENVDNVDMVIDKLYYLLENDVSARIGDTTYESKDLARIFISNLLSKYSDIEFVTIVLRNNNIKIFSKLKNALSQCINNDKKYKITTYSEAFIAYIKSKGEEFYNNPIALFDFTEKALTFYELLRYKTENDIEYWKVDTKEHLALPLDLLSGDAGKKVCDNLLCDFSKSCLNEEIYNNIILSGIGFNEASSYRDFMTYVCSITDVNTDVDFFAKSATIISKDVVANVTYPNIINMTDARTTVAIRLLAKVNQTNTKIELVKPGEEWFNIYNNTFNVIVEDEKTIKFEYLKVIEGVIKEFVVGIPEKYQVRQDKSNLFEVCMTFLQQNLLQITVTDKGFGEFYEPTFQQFTRDINL